MSTIRTTLHLTHEIQNADRYVRVPFDVPPAPTRSRCASRTTVRRR